jgi:3-phenylpropionate/trans-cinnamate dioxygenase ferredoxin component
VILHYSGLPVVVKSQAGLRLIGADSDYNIVSIIEEALFMSFKEISKIDKIAAGTMQGFEMDGKSILIANVNGKFFAMNGKCTHAGGDLAKGKLEGSTITCPRHGAKFEVTTGKNMAPPKIGPFKFNAKDETVYPLKVEGSSLLIDLG